MNNYKIVLRQIKQGFYGIGPRDNNEEYHFYKTCARYYIVDDRGLKVTSKCFEYKEDAKNYIKGLKD